VSLPAGAALGTTEDPKELIKGEPTEVDANAVSFRDEAKRIGDLADDLDAISISDWSGGFGRAAYDAARSAEQDKWKKYAELLKAAGTTLTTYAGALRDAQGKAADAITKWQQGEDATEQAVADYNTSVDNYNAYVSRQVCVPSYGGAPSVPTMGPAKPGPFVDPGESLREEAQELLDQAREALDDAGATAVKELGGLEGSKTEGESGTWRTDGDIKGPSFSWGDWKDTFGKNGADGADGKYDKPGSESPFKIDLGSVEGSIEMWGAEGSWEDYWAGGKVHADGSVTVMGAEGGAKASIGSDGLIIGANGKVTIVGAEGSVGAEWDHASVGAKGEVFVGGSAEGEARIDTTGVHANGEVFVGAKAEGELEGEVAGVGGKVEGEAWAGWGAAGDVDFGFDDGKFTIGGSGGLAFGVGGKIGGEITIDPGGVIDAGKDIIDGIGGLFS
jgi:hypothetical protein